MNPDSNTPAAPMRYLKNWIYALQILFLIVWSAYFISLGFYNDYPLYHDDSDYLCLGKSLAQGTGYKNIALASDSPGIVVPIAMPLLLSLYWHFPDIGIFFLKLFMAAILMSGVLISFFWLKKMIPPWEAFFVALAFSSMWLFVETGNDCMMTETLFIPFMYGGFFFSMQEDKTRIGRLCGWIGLAFWLLNARVRWTGPLFVAVYAGWRFQRRDWVKCIGALAGLLFLFLFERTRPYVEGFAGGHLYGTLHGPFPIFTNPPVALHYLLDILPQNIWAFAGSLYANLVMPYLYALVSMNPAKRIIVLLFFCYSCWGAVILWKTRPGIRWIISAIVLSWIPIFGIPESGAQFRYFFPYFPFLALCMLTPLHFLFDKHKLGMLRSAPLIASIVLACNQPLHTLQRSDWKQSWQMHYDAEMAHRFINASLVKPECIISSEIYYTYLSTGIHGYLITDCSDLSKWTALCEGRETWCVLCTGKLDCEHDRSSAGQLPPPLFTQGEWKVFRLH